MSPISYSTSHLPHWHKGNVPFARFLLAYMLGILAAFHIQPARGPYGALYLVSGVLLLLVVAVYLKPRPHAQGGLFGVLWCFFLFFVAMAQTWRSHPSVDQLHFSHFGKSSFLLGHVASELEQTVAKNHRFRFDIDGLQQGNEVLKATGSLQVTVAKTADTALLPHYGQVLVLPADYKEVDAPKNPYELDYKRYLSHKHIWHHTYLEASQLLGTRQKNGSLLVGYALGLRQGLIEKYRLFIHDEEVLSIISALVLGQRSIMSDEVFAAFSATGTIHVLSVSGMHVGLVFWLLSTLLSWMKGSAWIKASRWFILLFCIWSYALVTGFSSSVLRAAVMISFVVSASTFGRQQQVYNSIASSAFFLLLYDPHFLADVGFQLSYLAVLGIVWLHRELTALWPIRHRVARHLRDLCTISVSAQLFTTPLSLYYFHLFPTYFLLANLFITLPASLIIYGGLLLLFIPTGGMAALCAQLLGWLVRSTMDGLAFIMKWPFSTWQGLWFSAGQALFWYLLLFFALAALLYRKRWAVHAALFLSMCYATGSFVAYFSGRQKEEIVFYAVGKHWAISYGQDGRAWCFSNIEGGMGNRQFQYSVAPNLQHFARRSFFFVPADRANGSVLLSPGRYRIAVIDQDADPGLDWLNLDFVLLRHNALGKLPKATLPSGGITLVLDASNSDSTIATALREARRRGWNAYRLKDNFAYVWPKR